MSIGRTFEIRCDCIFFHCKYRDVLNCGSSLSFDLITNSLYHRLRCGPLSLRVDLRSASAGISNRCEHLLQCRRISDFRPVTVHRRSFIPGALDEHAPLGCRPRFPIGTYLGDETAASIEGLRRLLTTWICACRNHLIIRFTFRKYRERDENRFDW
jgi:hypothetical protein